jgi:lysozyme
LTIGYGHTGDVREGQYISEEEALDLLVEDLRAHAERLAPKVKVQVTDGQYIALLSLAFNVGVEAVAKSTLLRLLNAGDIEAAGDEFLKWTYADGRELPGLVRRRRDERKLFLEGTR